MQISLQAVLLALCLNVPILLFSQKAPKYGSISDEEKSITATPLDPEANAIILADYCETSFNGGNVDIIRHTRIKILNKNGLEHANIRVHTEINSERAHVCVRAKKENILKIKMKSP